MKISIITVCFNAEKTIYETLLSVKNQSYSEIEHIVVDGKSTDGTLKIIERFPHISQLISEPDAGMYDAINKGINLATGDYVGILNADDTFHSNETISTLAAEFEKDTLSIYFGDIRFVHSEKPNKTLRYYSAKNWRLSKFKWGIMPPHPSVYVQRALFKEHGFYKTDYHIAADYEFLVRYLYANKLPYRYLPFLMVDMKPGGLSNQSWKSRIILNKEIVRGCAENGITTSISRLLLKYPKRILEYLPFYHAQ